MATTINATVDATTVSEPIPASERFAATMSSLWGNVICKGATKAVKAVDSGLGVVLDAYVGVLQANDNIAIASSLSTLNRVLAYDAINKKYGVAAKSAKAAVTTVLSGQ